MEMVELLKAFEPTVEVESGQAPPVGGLVTGALKRAADSFLAHDSDRTPEPRSAEDLHDARVALRRVRSFLRTFRTVVDPQWAATVRADLGWFAGLLGDVRNLDVLARRVAERPDLEPDPAALEELLAAVAVARADSVYRLAEARVLPRYDTVLRQVDVLSSAQVPLSSRASEPVDDALPRLMRRPWRNVREAARASRRSPNEPTLHALRIRAKELRYAAEVASDVVGRRGEKLAAAAKRVQDRLGEHRDALSAVEFLAKAAVDHPGGAFLAGQLVVVERIGAERSLDRLGGDLATLRRRWRSFERALSS